LLIGGIVQDEAYLRNQILPWVDDQQICFLGPVNVEQKNEMFASAFALLHLNTIPERFGLVLAEANAAGVPVIAMDFGSCREVIEHSVTGFLVANVEEAVAALQQIPEIAEDACCYRVQSRFSIEIMVEGYERVYARIFAMGQ
jgi:glycosyltransferase involved in cell wall biosynthesis